MRETDIT